MASKPPVRQDAFEVSGARDLDSELDAQLQVREHRRAQRRKATRPKATYDLTLKLMTAVTDVAEREDIAKSDVVAWALCEFLNRYYAGDVDLEPNKKPARSLRVLCKLEIPTKWR